MKNEKEQHQEVPPLEQTNYPKERESGKEIASKRLSLQEREKLKKWILFAVLGLVFVLSIWYIFAPSPEDKKKTKEQAGINQSIPQASNHDLPDDKLKAYSLGTDEEKENKQQGMIGSLYDYFERESERKDNTLSDNKIENNDPVVKSVSQYQETTRMLQSFNEPLAYDSEKEELWQELDVLRSKLTEIEEAKNEETDHLALMEKSYQLAAKYLPQGRNTDTTSPFENAVERKIDDPIPNAYAKAKKSDLAFMVFSDSKEVVSSLYQDVPDSIFIAEQLLERNGSFLSSSQIADVIPNKNTLKAAVYETITLNDGKTVRLRLLESARVANMLIPKNTLLTAIAKIQGNRLHLSVISIEYRERIIAVNLSAYDLDGQQGVFIPNSEEMNAVKEVVAGMGQSAGTSFTFSSSAGQQLVADAGKGVIQGASQYIGKKMREVKVTLKSGHKLFLIANK